MKRLVLASLTALTLASPLAITTASAYDDVDARQARQQARIQDGVRSGEINRWENRQLQAEQARIADLERRAKVDGRVDYREAAQIRNAQNEASRHIYQESHDRDSRGSRSWFRRWWY